MELVVAILAAVLFFALTPNILLRLPKNGSKYTVAGVHAVVFVFAFWLLQKLLKMIGRRRDGFKMPSFPKKEENK